MTTTLKDLLTSHPELAIEVSEEKVQEYCSTLLQIVKNALPDKEVDSVYKTQTLSTGRKRYFCFVKEIQKSDRTQFYPLAQIIIDDDKELLLASPAHYTHPIRILNFYEPVLQKINPQVEELHKQLGFEFMQKQYLH